MLGHELRSPLAAIRNAGEQLSRMGPSEPGADIPLQVLRRQTKQLSRLLDDLLDIAVPAGTAHLGLFAEKEALVDHWNVILDC